MALVDKSGAGKPLWDQSPASMAVPFCQRSRVSELYRRHDIRHIFDLIEGVGMGVGLGGFDLRRNDPGEYRGGGG